MNSKTTGPSKKLKTVYKPFRAWNPIHTGNEAILCGNDELLLTTIDERVIITNLQSGAHLHTFEGDSSAVKSITCTPSPTNPSILIAYQSSVIRIYSIEGPFNDSDSITVTSRKSITKAHDAPVSVSISDPTSSVFATGDTAGVVRLWDVKNGHCTHVFKGHQKISSMSFDVSKSASRARLVVGANDGRIKLWDLRESQLIGLFEHAHVSAIRGLAITPDGSRMVSGSRDKVINLWDLTFLNPGKVIKTIPVYETIESIGLVQTPQSELHDQSASTKTKSKTKPSNLNQSLIVYTAGDKGIIRLWDLNTGKGVGAEEEPSTLDQHVPRANIVHTNFNPVTNTLLVTKSDQTLSLLSIPSLEVVRQIVGSHDEIIDTSFLHSTSSTDPPTHLAVVTNSPLIRVISLGVEENDASLLPGHSDVVLCLAKSRDKSWFVSGSKDKTARIWRQATDDMSSRDVSHQRGKRIKWECVGICEGHMQGLGGVSLAEFKDGTGKPITILATASQDRTVKLWDLMTPPSTSLSQEDSDPNVLSPRSMCSLLTLKVHEKDINAIDFSADGRLFATGSQDKLCKVFRLIYSVTEGTSLQILGILKGHQRGIWSLKFSTSDPYLVTGSADRTIKLWSVKSDGSSQGFGNCLKTFEGHLNAVLRVNFLNFGQQIVSSSSDALIKVWDLKTQVCVSTLGDETEGEESSFEMLGKKQSVEISHDSKIWALDVEDEEGTKLITAGADSKIIYWEDLTEQSELEKIKSKEEQVRVNQDVENYIRLKDYRAVVFLLLKLDKPVKLLRLFTDIGEDEEGEESITGSLNVDEVLGELKPKEVLKLLGYIRDWNSITRTAEVAQRILYAIFKFHSYSDLLRSVTDEEEVDELIDPDEKKKMSKPMIKVKELLDGLLPYTERHLGRLERLNQDVCVLQYILNQMGGGLCEF